MNRFLTIFPEAENVHLVKDVGMIPYVLYKDFGFDSTLACYKNSEYEYLFSEVEGLKLVFISKLFNCKLLDCSLFLLKNFHRYDFFQSYHLDKNSLVLSFLFKLLKSFTFSKSVTYIKLDADENIREVKLHYMHVFLLNSVDFLSIETKSLYNYLSTIKVFYKKIIYIPNGYYDTNESIIDFGDKVNLIITVGRIGTYQKNNELLLEAFKDFYANNQDWVLEIIGDIDNDFNGYIDSFFTRYPYLHDKVLFVGRIDNRRILELKYRKAKIFILTSRHEGFPLVLIEALRYGCCLITSSISAANDITNDRKNGDIFEIGDVNSLIQNLRELTNHPLQLEKNCYSNQKYAQQNFNWSKICLELVHHLRKV